MFTQALTEVDTFVQNRNASGAVALMGLNGQQYGPYPFGQLSFFPQANPVTGSSLYDLASLSKVVSTTTIVLRLVEEHVISLEDTIGHLVPNAPADKGNITITELLAHISGLPAVAPLHKSESFRARDSALQTALALPLARKPGTAVEYSCIGFIILGLIIEKLTKSRLDVLCSRLIREPLGLVDTGYNPSTAVQERIAYTEWDSEERTFLRGVVHDENARALGGISGNAGLFSSATDLAQFCQMLLQDGTLHGKQILKPQTVALFKQSYTAGRGEPRTLGWLLPSGRGCSGGTLLSQHAIGHTGFTGTSIWLDFERQLFGILLTNRVHPVRTNLAIIKLRPSFYEALCRGADKLT